VPGDLPGKRARLWAGTLEFVKASRTRCCGMCSKPTIGRKSSHSKAEAPGRPWTGWLLPGESQLQSVSKSAAAKNSMQSNDLLAG
jgi:hypothetical protein